MEDGSNIPCSRPCYARGFFLGKHLYYNHQFNRSRPDSEIISQLSEPMKGKAGISLEQQETMGVKMKIYALTGLKAHFCDSVPDYTDSSVFFITRSSDYRIKDGKKQIIGDYIEDGKIISESLWRAGFMAIKEGNAQIGISRSKKIGKYIAEDQGSMFRQLAHGRSRYDLREAVYPQRQGYTLCIRKRPRRKFVFHRNRQSRNFVRIC